MPNHSCFVARVATLAPATLAMLLATPARAESSCPDFVMLPSGSVFNIAKLIADTGSPEAALKKARTAVDQVSANGGCPSSVKRAVCEETMAVAKKAVVALEACVTHGPQADGIDNGGHTASK